MHNYTKMPAQGIFKSLTKNTILQMLDFQCASNLSSPIMGYNITLLHGAMQV